MVDIDSGRNLTEYLMGRIASAQICAFELSDKNPNVMFELGVAYAKGKKIILLVHERVDRAKLPSDLAGAFFRTYNDDTLRIAVSEEIYTKAMACIAEARDLQSVFALEAATKVNIVCPEIPPEFRTRYAAHKLTKDYIDLGRFGDPDAHALISTHIARVFSHIQIGSHVCTETPGDAYNYPLICIGGPGWNALTADLLRAYAVPLQYGDYSEGVEDFRITNTTTGKEYRTEIAPPTASSVTLAYSRSFRRHRRRGGACI